MRQIALLLTMMLALSSMAQTAKPQDPKAAIRKHYAAAKAPMMDINRHKDHMKIVEAEARKEMELHRRHRKEQVANEN